MSAISGEKRGNINGIIIVYYSRIPMRISGPELRAIAICSSLCRVQHTFNIARIFYTPLG